MSGSPSRTISTPDPARQRALDVLSLVKQGVPRAQICRHLRVHRRTIDRVVEVENRGGCATIQVRRSRARQREWRRQQIELVHELAAAKKTISRAEIARRLGVRETYRLPGICVRSRRRHLGRGAIVPHNSVLNNASNEPPRSGHCTIRDAAKRRSRSFLE